MDRGVQMSVTLSQLLMLVGPLDDNPGFDAARERFRRYLTENVAEIGQLRPLIEDGQRLVGDQPRRALQDALVVLGRFLGFETAFGAYQRMAGGVQFEGRWRSRHRLHILLETRSEEADRADPDAMTRALAALAANSSMEDLPRIGLYVVTPMFSARGHLSEDLLAAHPTPDRRVATTRSLLWLAEAVAGGRMTHEEVATLLLSGHSIDAMVNLFERFSTGAPGGAAQPEEQSGADLIDERVEVPVAPAPTAAPVVQRPVAAPSGAAHPDRHCWVVAVERSTAASFEQVIHSAIAHRHVLGVVEDRTLPAVAAAGDAVCFYVPGKGIVGQADVVAPVDPGLHLVRDADSASRLYRLSGVTLYETPIIPDLETQQMLQSQLIRAGLTGPLLTPATPHKFAVLTDPEAARANLDPRFIDGTRERMWPEAIDRASRSHV
jgi:hypothetical protein